MFWIDQAKIDEVKRNRMNIKVPFEHKYELSKKYDLGILDVQTIFNHVSTIDLFESLICQGADGQNQRDPKQVFKWLYNNIYGNIVKKEMDFLETLNDKFN